MPSFQRLLVLAILGVNFFANAAVVPNGESTDLAANENDVTPDYVTQAFAKVKSTPKKTTAKAPKKTTAKATPKKTTAKTTAKKTATPKKTTAKATPTVKKTTAKATPTVKKTTSKAAPTVKKTTSKVAASKKTAAPKSTKAKPSVKPTSVKKTSAKPKATGKSSVKPKSTKPTGTKVSSAKPSATSGAAACALKPKAKGTKATRDELHSFAARSNLVDLGGKEGRKGKELGSSAEATVYELTEWDGKSVSDQVIKLTEDQTEAEEVGNLKACQRYTFGPSMDCKSGMFGLVMHKGQGTVLDSVSGWKSNKKELIPKIAEQVAAMAVQWMTKYGRMHTDLHPGNIMVSGSGTSLTVVDFVDLGAMLQQNGAGTKGRGAFASWNTDAKALAQTLETDYLLK